MARGLLVRSATGLLAVSALVAAASGCAGGSAPKAPLAVAPPAMVRADVLVVMPHPDDEVILAAGVIARERAAGRHVVVAVVTNGDLSCERDGLQREAETVAAMKRLGLREDDIFFLGYPDGHLEELGHIPLEALPRRDRAGRCGSGDTTYAGRGRGRTDVHTFLTGRPAAYTSDALAFDIASLVARMAPRDIYVSHPIDEHPDHASVYVYVRRALEERGLALARVPRLHRGLVHVAGCYPTSPGMPPCPPARFAPGEDPPPLAPPFDVYRPAELLMVPEAMRLPTPEANPKYMAIAEYASQMRKDAVSLSYLFSFARAREPFFPETLERDGAGGEGRFRRAAATPRGPAGATAGAGEWRLERLGARRDLTQRAPLRCRMTEAEEESTLEILRAGEERYAVRTDAASLVLERHGAAGEVEVLRRWTLPLTRAGARHDLEIAVDVRPDDGGVGEITLRRDGELFGVAIDPRPIVRGTSIAVWHAPSAGVTCEAY